MESEKKSQKKWNPRRWKQQMEKYRNEGNRTMARSMRVDVLDYTIAACKSGYYFLEDGSRVELFPKGYDVSKDVQRNGIYHNTPQIDLKSVSKYANLDVSVLERDCLEVAIEMKKRGYNPVVLNMASMKRPGGGYKEGSGAQEENLFRRTNYFMHLEDGRQRKEYPLKEFGGLYSPNVFVFRGSEDDGYPFLPEPIPLCFMAVAAYAHPQLVEVGGSKSKGAKYNLAPKFADKTKQKIRTMFNIALENGHDSMVLSAFGCGAFGNPPEHMAKLFGELLFNEYAGCFKKVVFAIIEDANSRKRHNPEGNVLPFMQIFDQLNRSFRKQIIKEDKEEQLNQDPVDVKEIKFYRAGDPYGCFSNFFRSSFTLKGKEWSTGEHYFQAQQFAGSELEEQIRKAKTAKEAENLAKKNSKSVTNPNWEQEKVKIMKEALVAKFTANAEIRQILLDTKDAVLLFDSHDTYWGIGAEGKGKNKLGELLMEVRAELQLQ